jgi:hypothetical protein
MKTGQLNVMIAFKDTAVAWYLQEKYFTMTK